MKTFEGSLCLAEIQLMPFLTARVTADAVLQVETHFKLLDTMSSTAVLNGCRIKWF